MGNALMNDGKGPIVCTYNPGDPSRFGPDSRGFKLVMVEIEDGVFEIRKEVLEPTSTKPPGGKDKPEPVIVPVSKPASEPANKPALDPTIKPVNEPGIKPVIEPVLKPASEPVIKPGLGPVVKLVKGPVINRKTAYERRKPDGDADGVLFVARNWYALRSRDSPHLEKKRTKSGPDLVIMRSGRVPRGSVDWQLRLAFALAGTPFIPGHRA